MYGIYMDGNASSTNNGNLMFDESCTVTVKVYGEATEITVKVTDKGGYSKTITVNIGAVAAPTYSATVDNVDFGTVRVGYGAQDAKRVEVNNTGTGKLWTTGTCVRFVFLCVIISTFYLQSDSLKRRFNNTKRRKTYRRTQ